jgi:hypothetical protein
MLLALAALAGTIAAWLEDLPQSQSLEPDHSGVGTAGLFTAVSCLVALWRLGDVARGRGRWLAASYWFALALVGLLVTDAVALASRRLGG